jgi:hypothetical protein
MLMHNLSLVSFQHVLGDHLSHEPPTGSCPEPDQHSPQDSILSLQVPF